MRVAAQAIAVAAGLLAGTVGLDADAARALDPVGTWSCVLYGHPDFGDERVLLQFAPNGGARLARVTDERPTAWTSLAGWRVTGGDLKFGDPQTGRSFTADLRRETLGGGWHTATAVGGWWCSVVDDMVLPEGEDGPRRFAPLVPTLTATPIYPTRAIRDAKEGRAVACFFVGADGTIVEPELIELSDEIFRAPVLAALGRSRYQPWVDDGTRRPSCRTYTFGLDSLLRPES